MIGRMPAYRLLTVALVIVLGAAVACSNAAPGKTAADARAFLANANETLLRRGIEASQAGWVQNTYITPDTEAMAARASEAFMTAATEFSKQAPQ
jgi:peptidyl-dipeptidase A